MGLSNAILTGFTGIETNQLAIDTIGNNVANVNTTGFKGSRALFETLMFHTTEGGTAPDQNQGGTNPVQFGFGAGLATTQRDFSQGTFQQTGVPSDLAIDGNGLFVINRPPDGQVYTRDGAFQLNTSNELVTASGGFVQGFAASSDGTIEMGSLSNLTIPLGELSSARATTQARFFGNLNAGSELATDGSSSVSNQLFDASGAPATASTRLTDLHDEDGAPLFSQADVVVIRNIQKGGIDINESQFTVGADVSTYGDFATFLQDALSLDTSEDAVGSPGVFIGEAGTLDAGALIVNSNASDANSLSFGPASIRNDTNGLAPLTFNTEAGTGEGVTTTAIVYDSLGTPIDIRIRMYIESQGAEGTQWKYTVESGDDSVEPQLFGRGGTINFDQSGAFASATETDIEVRTQDSGAISPFTFNLDLSGLTGLTSITGQSTLALADQDGYSEGVLVAYEIDREGIINGTFSNGEQRVFGQLALATFTNPMGLVAKSENVYSVGVNSGDPVILAPTESTAGALAAGTLEISNVDLSRELIGLLTASNGFSAASRTIRTADEMLQELLLLVR